MKLELPDPLGVVALRDGMHRQCKNNGSEGDWLFDFILFSGSRIEAAGDVQWRDIA